MDNILKNLVRVGNVCDIDEKAVRARVEFDDLEDTVSNWLPIGVRGTKSAKDYWMPDIGEQVVCLFLPTGNADGFILCSFYDDKELPPIGDKNKRYVRFSDGTVVEHDQGSGTLTVTSTGAVNINASSGDVVVNGISLVNHTHPESIGTVTGPPG